MDKNGKIKGKISIIDIAVIILVIAAAIGIAVRFTSETTTAVTSNITLKYDVKVNAVRRFTVDALEKSTTLTDKKAELNLGEIKNIETTDSKIQSTTTGGKIKWAELPDKYTCIVTIESEARESEEGYVLDDTTEISVGRTMELYTKYVKTTGEIVSVEVVD